MAKNLLDHCGPGVLVAIFGVEEIQPGGQSREFVTDLSALGGRGIDLVFGLGGYGTLQRLALSLNTGPDLLLGTVADLGPAQQPEGSGVMRAVFHGEGAV